MSSVAIVSVGWFTSTSWQRDQFLHPIPSCPTLAGSRKGTSPFATGGTCGEAPAGPTSKSLRNVRAKVTPQ